MRYRVVYRLNTKASWQLARAGFESWQSAMDAAIVAATVLRSTGYISGEARPEYNEAGVALGHAGVAQEAVKL